MDIVDIGETVRGYLCLCAGVSVVTTGFAGACLGVYKLGSMIIGTPENKQEKVYQLPDTAITTHTTQKQMGNGLRTITVGDTTYTICD